MVVVVLKRNLVIDFGCILALAKPNNNTINSGHLVAEEESLEELQGSEIIESDFGE